jgi:uncharacterized protein (DUF885 family)
MGAKHTVLSGLICVVSVACASAQPQAERGASMREFVERHEADREALKRYWTLESSARRAERLETFDDETLRELERVDFDALDRAGKVDWILLRHELESDRARIEIERRKRAELAPLVPFLDRVLDLVEVTQRLEPVDPERAAEELDALVGVVADARKATGELKDVARSLAVRASSTVRELDTALADWFRERDRYDPQFSWWAAKPKEALSEALSDYAKHLREDVAKLAADDDETIVGDPIGREALLAELQRAMIPYSPEELLEVADREFAWCEREMLAASRAMGFGDDWRAALERVKQDHVGPGEQPALIRELAAEAIDFIESRELLTIPALAKETWRMEMMTPERQLVNPFFTGGEVISVSYPTADMEHDKKVMSLRGNNRHFARATVHHELIPGHHLQQFMTRRFQPHRRGFATPFWTEGWALWWEMLLWNRGFATTPEDKIGMLFWRSHRCARIRFSLSFHLGLWTPEQCIDFLVERVGHERENAAGEVRRSFNGSYGPLYQIAYMLGALQLRELHRELVDSGRFGEREFHDAVLENGNMPIEMVRASLSDVSLGRDFRSSWRFYALE